jgi:hypothetical protein
MNKDDFSVGKINWIEEEIHTKESFVNKKHDISYLFLYSIRIFFIGFLAFLFYVLPNPIDLFSKIFGISEFIKEENLLKSFLYSFIFCLITILYSNSSIKYKHFFSVFIITSFILFLVISVGLQIINLNITTDNEEYIMLV